MSRNVHCVLGLVKAAVRGLPNKGTFILLHGRNGAHKLSALQAVIQHSLPRVGGTIQHHTAPAFFTLNCEKGEGLEEEEEEEEEKKNKNKKTKKCPKHTQKNNELLRTTPPIVQGVRHVDSTDARDATGSTYITIPRPQSAAPGQSILPPMDPFFVKLRHTTTRQTPLGTCKSSSWFFFFPFFLDSSALRIYRLKSEMRGLLLIALIFSAVCVSFGQNVRGVFLLLFYFFLFLFF
jgi:hypothetical protein